MKKIIIVSLMLIFGFSGAVAASDSKHEGKPHWGYSGDVGPNQWGELNSEFSTCSTGRSQSPINIVNAIDVVLPPIKFNYQNSSVYLVNNGHTVQANYSPGSSITVDGKKYELLQFHFHTLSENAINGKLFPLEAHLVHKDGSGNLAVVSVMFEDGAENPFVQSLWDRMPVVANSTMQVSGQSINVINMLPETKDYFSWTGSLTTPPCTEGVKWMLLQEPVQISKAQANKLERTLGVKNNRPVQPLNGRKVYK